MFALPLTVNKGFISGVLFQLPTGRTFQPILQPLAVVAMLNTDQFQKLSSPLVSWTHNIEKNGTGWKKKLPTLTFKSVMAPNKHILDNLPSFHLLSWHTHHSKPPATSCVHLLCVLFYTYHGWPLWKHSPQGLTPKTCNVDHEADCSCLGWLNWKLRHCYFVSE